MNSKLERLAAVNTHIANQSDYERVDKEFTDFVPKFYGFAGISFHVGNPLIRESDYEQTGEVFERIKQFLLSNGIGTLTTFTLGEKKVTFRMKDEVTVSYAYPRQVTLEWVCQRMNAALRRCEREIGLKSIAENERHMLKEAERILDEGGSCRVEEGKFICTIGSFVGTYALDADFQENRERIAKQWKRVKGVKSEYDCWKAVGWHYREGTNGDVPVIRSEIERLVKKSEQLHKQKAQYDSV